MAVTEDSHTGDSNHEAISFGEIVFDCFEGAFHLGGAPLNFAYYLRQFGVSVALVSAVGRDDFGEKALRLLTAADVDTTWVQSRPEPTGTVDVRLVNGAPEFIAVDGCAWERIGPAGGFDGVRPALLYFGTVAQKTATNRTTFDALYATESPHTFLDINLRPRQYSPELVVDTLNKATILKMNENEWQMVRKITSQDTLAGLQESFDLEMIAITWGSRGAQLQVAGERYVEEGLTVKVVDPIGSGDAFSAALAAGVIRSADPGYTLRVACDAGAATVQRRGALVGLPNRLRKAFS